MKTSIKTMAAIFMAGLVWTGCIDTAVAPEVKAIREQHVAVLQAQARLSAAQAEQVEIQNDFDAAMNALELQEAQADLELALANIDVEVKYAEQALQQAELALQQSIDQLAQYVATQGTATAQAYLEQYQDAVGELSDIVGDQVETQAELSRAQAILASVNNEWDVAKAALQDDLDAENATLTAQTASLADLQAVVDGSTSKADMWASLTAENADLEEQLAANRLEDKQQVAVALAASDANDNGQQIVSDYESAVADTASTSDDLADAKVDLAALNATLAVKANNKSDWTAAYTPLKATYDAKVSDEATKYNAYLAAENDLTVAQQKEAAGTGTAAQTTAATTARDAAQTAYNNAVTATGTAATNLSQVEGNYFNSLDEYDAAAGAVADQEQYISDLEVELIDEIAAVNNMQAAYDEVDLVALQIAEDNAWREEDLIDDERDAINAQIDANDFVLNALENYFDNLGGRVDDLKSDIETTRGNIASLESQIADQDVAKASQSAEVVRLTAELADLQAQENAQRAIVASLLDLLNTTLGIS
jgi:chromosome segregation ATPase